MKLFEVLKFLVEGREDWIRENLGDKILKGIYQDTSFPELTDALRDPDSVLGPEDERAKLERKSIDQVIELSKAIDPTPNNKYLQWIIMRYANGEFRMKEDSLEINNALQTFETFKKYIDKKDINQYKSLGDFYEAMREFENTTKDDILEQHLIDTKEIAVIYEKNGERIMIPKTYKASEYLAKHKWGTNWCTKNPNMYNSYTEDGPLFIVEASDGKVYQFHFESNQYMDRSDSRIDVGEMMKESNAIEWLIKGYLNKEIPADFDEAYKFVQKKRLGLTNEFTWHLLEKHFPEEMNDPQEYIDKFLKPKHQQLFSLGFALKKANEKIKEDGPFTSIYKKALSIIEEDRSSNLDVIDIPESVQKRVFNIIENGSTDDGIELIHTMAATGTIHLGKLNDVVGSDFLEKGYKEDPDMFPIKTDIVAKLVYKATDMDQNWKGLQALMRSYREMKTDRDFQHLEDLDVMLESTRDDIKDAIEFLKKYIANDMQNSPTPQMRSIWLQLHATKSVVEEAIKLDRQDEMFDVYRDFINWSVDTMMFHEESGRGVMSMLRYKHKMITQVVTEIEEAGLLDVDKYFEKFQEDVVEAATSFDFYTTTNATLIVRSLRLHYLMPTLSESEAQELRDRVLEIAEEED